MTGVNLRGNVRCLKRYRILLDATGFCASEQQQAQLSQRDRAMLRVTSLSHSMSPKVIRMTNLSRSCVSRYYYSIACISYHF